MFTPDRNITPFIVPTELPELAIETLFASLAINSRCTTYCGRALWQC